MTAGTSRVLMIGLDAAEPELIERWTDDGSLPHLSRLRERGAFGRLASSADWLAGSPWPTFYTSTPPEEHGLYHFLMWRADQMAAVRPSADRFALEPFWRRLSASGARVIALDVPLTFPPTSLDGIEISGWASHDLLAPPYFYPASLERWARSRFGRPPRADENYRLTRPGELLRERDALTQGTASLANLAESLLRKEPWELSLVCFGATHRGGHKLWDLTGIAGQPNERDAEELSGALRRVYVACDDAIGRLIDAADDGTTVLVFSLHGMGPNTDRTDLLPEMLARVLADGPPEEEEFTERRPGLLKRLRAVIPSEWRYQIKHRLPLAWQDKLTTFWRRNNTKWESTQATSLIADLQGYVRINLRGRESLGCVEPGEQYERVCQQIIEGLGTFADAGTGEPLIERIGRRDEIFSEGIHREDLPDLIVRWAATPAAAHRALESSRYGTIPWPTPARHFTGRSGNHRPEGFVLAAGERIQANSRIDGAHILDLAPTVCELLTSEKPPNMRGRRIATVL